VARQRGGVRHGPGLKRRSWRPPAQHTEAVYVALAARLNQRGVGGAQPPLAGSGSRLPGGRRRGGAPDVACLPGSPERFRLLAFMRRNSDRAGPSGLLHGVAASDRLGSAAGWWLLGCTRWWEPSCLGSLRFRLGITSSSPHCSQHALLDVLLHGCIVDVAPAHNWRGAGGSDRSTANHILHRALQVAG
jgi:hypothetical protein